jgi:hypothetical protein
LLDEAEEVARTQGAHLTLPRIAASRAQLPALRTA